jgi:hypothetical protein
MVSDHPQDSSPPRPTLHVNRLGAELQVGSPQPVLTTSAQYDVHPLILLVADVMSEAGLCGEAGQ